MKKLFIPIYIMLLLFCSCEQEHTYLPSGTVASFVPLMESDGSVPSSLSFGEGRGEANRVQDNLWTGTETVGVAAFDATNPETQVTTKYHKYIPNGGMSGTHVQLVPAASETPIYYPINGDAVTFTAFAPYPSASDISSGYATFSESTNTVTYYLNKQTTATNIMEKIDFIHHQGTTPYSQSAPIATLGFEHKLSRVIINLTRSTDYSGSISGSSVVINNVYTAVACNTLTGTVTGTGSGTLPPARVQPSGADANATQVFQAIVAPQTATSTPKATDRKFTFTVAGNTYEVSIPQDFEAGNLYTYNFAIGTTLIPTGTTVTKWDESTIDKVILGPSKEWKAVDWTKPLVFEGESNCYIVPPGGQLLIPISRAKTFADSDGGQDIDGQGTKFPVIEDGEKFYAQVIWTDNNSAIPPGVKNLTCIGIGPNGYILVKPGTETGNAVVALLKKLEDNTQTILWSWHVWITDFNPQETTYTNNGYTFMDRNLGAISATPGEVDALGMLYQWGRKDPFPGSSSINANEARILYGSLRLPSTFTMSYPKGVGSTGLPMATSITSPWLFYYLSGTIINWCSDNPSDENSDLHINNRWGYTSGKKTLYDPCPVGWRVPALEAFEGFDTKDNNKYVFEWTSYGRTSVSLGWWPANGSRWGNEMPTKLGSTGTMGYYWSTSPSSSNLGYANSFSFNSSDVVPKVYFRTHGCAVRCVQ